MGVVFKAFDDGLNRHAVVKTFLLKQATDAEMRRRLRLEAQAQARLQHENIVAVYGLIEDEPDLFIAMEYVEGETLQQLLEARSRRAMTLAEAMPIFGQILEALEFVHGHGVVHRDIKPANVMISGGCVKLMDFGIALMADIPRQTTTIIGTPPYMSPEQFHPSGKIDHRTDIYSAAVVLYEMLAGRLPFEEKEWAANLQARVLAPPDLKSLIPDLPAGVSDAVVIALRREPDERFETIAKFRKALEEGASGFLPVAPDPESEIPTVPLPREPEVTQFEPAPQTDRQTDTPHAGLLWIVSSTVVLGSVVASVALLKHMALPPVPIGPPGKAVQRASAITPPPTVIVEPVATPAAMPPAGKTLEKPLPFPTVPPALSTVGNEARRREIELLRDEIARSLQRAEAFLADEKFDAVQEEIDGITDKVQRHPDDFWPERDEVRRLTKRLNDARVAAQTHAMQEAMWDGKLTEIREYLDAGKFPEAKNAAERLLNDARAPERIVSRARELLQESKDGFVRAFKDARTGETKNTIRKPSSPPRN